MSEDVELFSKIMRNIFNQNYNSILFLQLKLSEKNLYQKEYQEKTQIN